MIQTTSPLPLLASDSASETPVPVVPGPVPTHAASAVRPAVAEPVSEQWQTEASTPTNAVLRRLHGLGADTSYLLVSLPWLLAGFVVVFSGLALSLPLMVLGVGFPLAVGVLAVGRWFAAVERSRTAHRARLAGDRPILAPAVLHRAGRAAGGEGAEAGAGTGSSAAPSVSTVRRIRASLADAQGWREVTHALTAWIVSIVTMCLTVTWWAVAVAGVTAFVWDQYLPASTGAEELSGAARDVLEVLNSTGFRFGLGIVFLLTLLPVTRALARLQVGFARTLLEVEG